MLGINKREYEKLKKKDFSLKDVKPLSPLPLIEETVSAFLCLVGDYKCFPWKGNLCTFVHGVPKIVKSNSELKYQKTNREKTKEKHEDKNGFGIEGFEGEIPNDFYKDGTITQKREGCLLKCQYNDKGACRFNELENGETACDDPFLENQKLNAKNIDDLL